MKTNDRFNVYDNNSNHIAFGNMIEPDRFSLANSKGIYFAYGIFTDKENFNVYDQNNMNRIGYGIMNSLTEFNIYNLGGERIWYGSKE